MGAEITLHQLDVAVGTLIRASEMTPMVRGEHNACMQAIQVVVAYINQERAKQPAPAPEAKPKE